MEARFSSGVRYVGATLFTVTYVSITGFELVKFPSLESLLERPTQESLLSFVLPLQRSYGAGNNFFNALLQHFITHLHTNGK